MGVLQLTEQGIDDGSGGVVNRQQQCELRSVFSQAICGSCRLPESAYPHSAYADAELGAFGGRRLRGLFTPALVSILRNVSRPMSIPSRSLSNSLRCVWLTPAYLRPSQTYCFDRQCARCSIGRAATSVAVS